MTISSSFLKVYIFKLTEIFYLHLLFGKRGLFGIIVLPDACVYIYLHIYVYIYIYIYGFPCDSHCKGFACSAGNPGLIPGL